MSRADFLCADAPPGVRHSGVYRPRGDPASGLREAGGLVGDGRHPVRVPGGLCPLLRRHARGTVQSGHQRWVAALNTRPGFSLQFRVYLLLKLCTQESTGTNMLALAWQPEELTTRGHSVKVLDHWRARLLCFFKCSLRIRYFSNLIARKRRITHLSVNEM